MSDATIEAVAAPDDVDPRDRASFDPPGLWRALRERVIPSLRTYPSVLCWVPVCGTGESAYAIAALLDDAGLLGRARIYATDARADALAKASAGIVDDVAGARARWEELGATVPFDRVVAEVDGRATFAPALRAAIWFAEHNVATDASPNEFQVVLRPATIDALAPATAARADDLIRASLCMRGVVVDRDPSPLADDGGFERLDASWPLFQRRW